VTETALYHGAQALCCQYCRELHRAIAWASYGESSKRYRLTSAMPTETVDPES
jgi:hypothetical protein